ncbi:MAG: hypothetical protein IJ017_04965 [Oscillospiraceae bacterium]|nr:hypothetical protein [Oscillospiraceae bacterium]
MGLFSDVKCGRCDRRYSGLRARCPYCGARRGKRGKHARDNDNSTGRLIIGLILVVVLIVAVIAVIATNVTGEQPDAGNENQETNQGGNIADSDGVTNVEGVGAGDDEGTDDGSDAGDDTGTEGDDEGDADADAGADADVGSNVDVPDVSTAVNTLYITNPWSTEPQQDFTANVGDVIKFSYVAVPDFEDAEVLWETSDDNVFVILQTGEFTAVGKGTAKLSLTVNDKTIELYVVVR